MARKQKVTAAQLTQASADQLMDDLHTVLEDAEALLSATAGQAGERIQQVRARAEETVRAARDRLAAAQDEVTRRAREAIGDADAQRAEFGAEHPLGPAAPADRPESVRSERGDDVLRTPRLGGGFARRARPARGRPYAAGQDGSHTHL